MRILKNIIATATVIASLLIAFPSAASAAAPTVPSSCLNVSWSAAFAEGGNVNANTELAAMRKAFARASMLTGATFTYQPVGYDFKTADGGYAGYDYVPSPPQTRVRNGNALAILFTVTDLPDTVLPDGAVALGNTSAANGLVTGAYDASVLLQYPVSLRSDYYYVTVQTYLKGCLASA